MNVIVQAKGQITLPVEARQELGVGPGDGVVVFRNERGGWEVTTLERLMDDLEPVTRGLVEWSRKVKPGYRPKA